MPSVLLWDESCRVRPMLQAIGAQEALEEWGKAKPMPAHGALRMLGWEQEAHTRARRRNAAERKLRLHERLAWERWRRAGTAERAAVYAMLTDLPAPEDQRSAREGRPTDHTASALE